jgi:hypothetical protein
MIPDRPDHIPDSIEPLVGYRAWLVAGASLLPISHRDPTTTTSPWDGANRRWVSATCCVGTPEPMTDSMRKRLEHSSSKLGFPFESFPDGPHTVPGEDCSCGFYAMKELNSMLGLSGPGVVLGRVELAGEVIEYTLGYRAERARIAELIIVAGDRRSAEELALRLELPLRLGLPLASATPPWNDGLPPAA